MKILLIIFVCLTQASCGQNNANDKFKFDSALVISSDTSQRNRAAASDSQNRPKDTLTANRWLIKYKVIGTESNDLSIEWSKGSIDKTYLIKDVLELKNYFIPSYVGENEDFLFLQHACSSECLGILVLPKNDRDKVRNYLNVAAFDILSNNILKAENSKKNNLFKLQLVLINLKNEHEQLITFKNLCMAATGKENNCIDSINIKDGYIYIKAQLTSPKDSLTTVYEEKRIGLMK